MSERSASASRQSSWWRQGLVWIVAFLLFGAILITPVLIINGRYYNRIEPSEGDDLDAVFARIHPRLLYRWDAEGETRFTVLAALPPISITASGSPAFVFDDEGKLLDWTPDEGDDPDFHTRWPMIDSEVITVEEMRTQVESE